MTASKTNSSIINKYNTVAVILVCIAFIYVWKIESTPKLPLDRTVTLKTLTGTNVSPTVPVLEVNTNTALPEVRPEQVVPKDDTSTTTTQSGNTTSWEDNDTVSVSNIPPPVIATEIPLSSATGAISSGTTSSGVISYYNAYLDYGLSLPKGSYYAGYGGQDGAAHTMGFASGTGVTSFEEATVKLWYYPNKLLTELGNGENSFYQNPGTNMTYLKLGNGTIKIEGNMEDPIVLKIIETVYRGD